MAGSNRGPIAPVASYSDTHGAVQPVASGSSLGSHRALDDSDPEGERHERPKKKRRRQALSCTGM
ncbi:hypothetical protein CERSUDRAFT_64399 [Gelatoporia subvermispora B]|uniref:Uncharacterized protein n=1 Tax=Ceriporiopsis subvermispora (strain B) TaxID=914234 RepID=M2RH40_CERS8|nr:hypothetical protein CERSUDRAFT_64399 [Gelatoporia subvermispora B]